VLVDLENVLFGTHESLLSPEVTEQAATILSTAQARRPTDQLVVGCNPRLVFAARAAFPRAQLLTRIGADGADNALIESLDIDRAAERFAELCIVSGDHAFAEIAHLARRAGLAVRVVAPRFGLSGSLRIQANVTVMLPDFTLDPATLRADLSPSLGSSRQATQPAVAA